MNVGEEWPKYGKVELSDIRELLIFMRRKI